MLGPSRSEPSGLRSSTPEWPALQFPLPIATDCHKFNGQATFSAQKALEERLVAMCISSAPIPPRLRTQNSSMGTLSTSVQVKLQTTRPSDSKIVEACSIRRLPSDSSPGYRTSLNRAGTDSVARDAFKTAPRVCHEILRHVLL